MDWNDGEYERTAVLLEPASVVAVDAAKIERGTRVLDLGTGTGNAAILAARAGASVIAIDPGARLVEVCRARAKQEDLAIDAKVGDAGNIPAPDASFDVVLSVFAVIFAPDAEQATKEMLRVLRPNGRAVVTSWTPKGPISRAGQILRNSMSVLDPNATRRPGPSWGEPDFVRSLFARVGFASTTIEEHTLAFEGASPEGWLDDQVSHHPIWGGVRDALIPRHPKEWERVREECISILRQGNEDPKRFRTTSSYLVIVGTKSP